MYLKRLDISGFKSFAGRSAFEFGQGMTAIVGPNGSGKSNVSDALRWVLGEQSGKLLRARKLEDIIYAGSAKRSPASKVEVTITLDNSDSWLPLNFSEVAITRRGHRSGEGEYFINGKRVRLRDIQDLLMQADASQSSYAIIGQGMVESALNLRPEERRELIEEAADIQRYRLKIEEARDRLAAMHENIERIRLLLREIAPRLGQLERQARRAADHARLSKQLMEMLRAYYDHQWRQAHESLIVGRASHDQAHADFTQAKVALDTCQRELGEVSRQLDEYRRASAASAAERDRLEQKVRDLEKRCAVVQDRRALLEARQQDLRSDLARTDSERERLLAGRKTSEVEREQLQQNLSEARKALEQRQADVSALEKDFLDARENARDAEGKSKRLRRAAIELRARIQRIDQNRSDLIRDGERLDSRRRSVIKQMAEHIRVLRDYRAQEGVLLSDVSQVSARRQVLEQETTEIQQALARVEANQNARRGKLEAMEARLAVLNKAREQMQRPENEVSVQGAIARIFEIIRVPSGLERAITAALAEQLDAFVFEQQANAIAAIEAVVAQNGARATVLPLDAVKQLYPLNLIKEKGVLGVASRLVKYPGQYEKLVNALLGRTIIVQDTATAVRVLKRALGNVVTLEGIAFHAGGLIAGGQVHGSQAFVLGYERDMESIPKEIEKTQRSLALTEREVDTLRERLREKGLALTRLNQEADKSLERRLRLHGSLAERQQKVAQLRGELRGLIMSQGSLKEQDRSLGEESLRLEQEIASLVEEAEQADRAGEHLARANAIVHQQRDGLIAAAREAQSSVSRLEAHLRTIGIEQETSRSALTRLEAESGTKSEQLVRLDEEIAQLESSARGNREELARSRKEMESFLQQALPGPESAHHLEARERDLHSQVLTSQKRVFESERRLLEADAEVRRWQEQVDTLRRRIADDGLTITTEGDVIPPGAQPSPPIPPWLAAQGPDEGQGGLRPISGGANINPESLGQEIERVRGQLRSLGSVNVEAQSEYEELKERHDFLSGQIADLEGAEKSLHRAMDELHKVMRKRFDATFALVAAGFEQNFKTFFGGGEARLILANGHDQSRTGVEIEAQPPGKRTRALSQLSGGEKCLTAVSLLFALLQVNPSPFCVLDEVDAMLDESNVVRFVSALKELSERTQFVVITHNRRTIEVANSIYGVSMGPDGASRLLSLRLADVALEN